MKKLLLGLSLIYSCLGFSQYGNEWIDYGQKYYSFKVPQDGIYKLDYNLLTSANVSIPVSTINPFGLKEEVMEVLIPAIILYCTRKKIRLG